MADTVFADGMYIDWLGKNHEKRPPNAPAFVKGKFSFKADAFIRTLQNNVNEKGYVNIDLKAPKNGGNLYLAVDTWRPTQQQAPPQQQPPQQQASQFTQNNNLAPPTQDTTDYGPKDEFGF